MLVKSVELETVCGPTSRLPVNTAVEAAFAGRSNVGKSSLINALTGRRAIARVSGKPGKTQTINFYRVEAGIKEKNKNFDFILVDLPGYGYAKRSKEEIAKWGPMIERYLKHSGALKCLFLLIDIRHDAFDTDRQMLEFARHSGIRCVIVATKADKLGKNELIKQTNLLMKQYELQEGEEFITFSAMSKMGLERLHEIIEEIAG